MITIPGKIEYFSEQDVSMDIISPWTLPNQFLRSQGEN